MEDYISFPMSFLHTKNIIFSNYASILRVQPAVKNKTMLGLSGRHVYPHEAITCTSTALELAYPLVSPPRSTSTILHPLLPSLHLSFSSPSAQTEHAASLPRDPHPDLPLLWDTPPLPPTPTAARIPPLPSSTTVGILAPPGHGACRWEPPTPPAMARATHPRATETEMTGSSSSPCPVLVRHGSYFGVPLSASAPSVC